MITVQDRIEVAPAELEHLRTLLRERYLPGALARGLRLVDEQLTPPLRLAAQPNVLWLRWTLPDAGAFWAARFAAGDPEVASFWREVDGFVIGRERHFLVAAGSSLPGPQPVDEFRVTPRGWRETAQLYLREATGDALAATLGAAAPALPGVRELRLGVNLVPENGAGNLTWDLVYDDAQAAEAARSSPAWRERILPALEQHCRARSALGLQTLGAGARMPGLAGGIKRTALFRLLPGVDEAAARRFEQDTLEMAAHIPAILNWRLSRAQALDWDAPDCAPWSYVWEQEYATLDGLNVDYMMHPHHWAYIDRAFDPESGAQLIDTALCHAFCPLERSVIVV